MLARINSNGGKGAIVRRAIRVLALLSLISLQVSLCQNAAQDEVPNSKPAEFQEFSDGVVAAPPELAADLLLKLVERGAVKARERKIELIEQVFLLALGAKFPLKRGGSSVGIPTDSDVGAFSRSLQAGLDTLSLRCRAVRQMLLVDPARALDLFQQIPRPDPPSLSCKDALGYSVADYYALAGDLANRAFSLEERKESKHIQFLESQVVMLKSPFQLQGMADAVLAAKPSTMDLERLVGLYTPILRTMDADPRSFLNATYGMNQGVGRLAAACRDSGVSANSLMEAARAFLVKHASGGRCGELREDRVVSSQIIEPFNKNLLPILGPAGATIAPIRLEELKAKEVLGRAEVTEFWPDPGTDVLLNGVKRFRFGLTEEQRQAVAARGRDSGNTAPFLTLEERKTPEWESALRDFLTTVEDRIRGWDESESLHFHKICFTYIPLAELAPTGEMQDMIVRSLVGFLSRSPVLRSSPPEWFMEFSRLVLHGDGTPEGRNRALAAVRNSGSTVMSLHMELERLAPQPQ